MNRRIAVYELLARFALAAPQRQALEALAGLDEEPGAAKLLLPRVIAVLGAALVGLGIILWLAANWAELERALKFGLLEGVIALSLLAAMLRPAARAPLLLLAMLCQGGVLAYFGQTYQTGADAWQLFALWAALALPLALAARSDVLWLPLGIVATTAIVLWINTHTGRSWALREDSATIYYLGWIMAMVLPVALSPLPALRRVTGAGLWSFRMAATLTISLIGLTALAALFNHHVAFQYYLGILVLAGAGYVFARGGLPDVFALSITALAFDTLLICGLGRWLFDGRHGDPTVTLLLLGLFSAGLVAATATVVRQFSRQEDAQ